MPDWIESEWLKQFVGEQLVTVKTKRGFSRLEWQKLRECNEAPAHYAGYLGGFLGGVTL